jgi:hypothetical protein
MKDPQIIDNVFNDLDFNNIKNFFYNIKKDESTYSKNFGRYLFGNSILDKYAEIIIPKARKIFNSETLLHSYSIFAHYEGKEASLHPHKDDNACTYTLDLCVYQNKPWDIWVEGKNYTLSENQALAFYGNDQEHWRESFPNPDFQYVGMIFFHFVEPDHWWYTKGPDYLNLVKLKNTNDKILKNRKTEIEHKNAT